METTLRIAGMAKESIVDGPGIRFTVFTQGCNHHCTGCHNPHTHNFGGGNMVTIDSLIGMMRKDPLLDGITLSGGEPFEQAEACSELARRAHEMKLNVMTFSGYTFEELVAGFDEKPGWKALLHQTDILVDGRFVLEKRNILLKFRGSENQRLVDVGKSLKKGSVVPADL
ncbi:MAG: anaerobic ribonucleoside-triphosphate reductase activating protein [Clostridiaceae bacterium]